MLWQDFYPLLLPWVQSCTSPMMDQELRRAANEFYTRSRAWCVWLDPITTVTDVREYDLIFPTGANLVRIEAINVGTTPIDVASYRDIGNATTAGNTDTGYTRDTKKIVLDSTYTAGQSISVFASLAPARTATGIADSLFDRHSEAIVEGAKARLMLMPGALFFNADAADVARKAFDEAIVNAHLSDWRGATAVRKRVSPNFF